MFFFFEFCSNKIAFQLLKMLQQRIIPLRKTKELVIFDRKLSWAEGNSNPLDSSPSFVESWTLKGCPIFLYARDPWLAWMMRNNRSK